MVSMPKPPPEDLWGEWAGAVRDALRLPIVFIVVYSAAAIATGHLLMGYSIPLSASAAPLAALATACPLLLPIVLYWDAYRDTSFAEHVGFSVASSALIVAGVGATPALSEAPQWLLTIGYLVWIFLSPTVLLALRLRTQRA